MSEIQPTTTTPRLDNLLDIAHRPLATYADKWRKTLFFTQGGRDRLSLVLGYVIGLHHAGQTDLAENMLEDLETKLDYLAMAGRYAEFAEELKIPFRKTCIYDDGTFHGFGFTTYYAVNPDYFDAAVQEEYKSGKYFEDREENWELAQATVKKSLRIREHSDQPETWINRITEHPVNSQYNRVYYSQGHHGGLLYHGPGGGETFSVTIGNPRFWSIHT